MSYYKCPSYDNKILNFPTIEAPISGSIVTFNTSMATQLFGLKVGITAQQASGTPTPSTPKAITGFSEVNISNVGKNIQPDGVALANRISSFFSNSSVDTTNKTVSFQPASNEGYPSILYNLRRPIELQPFVFPFKENTRYTFIFKATSSGNLFNMGVSYTDGTNNGGFRTSHVVSNNTVVWTSPSDKTISSFYVGLYGGTTTLYYDTIAVIEGVATLADYEPYNPQSDTFTLPLGQTIYGGYVDWKLGKLVVTHLYVKMADLTWIGSNGIFENRTSYEDLHTAVRGSYTRCDIYDSSGSTSSANMRDKTIQTMGGSSSSNFWVKDLDYSTAQNFIDSLGNHEIVYQLAIPIEIDLPTTMPQTIEGVQNWFADTGDILELQYIETVQEYLNKHNTI